MRSREAAGRLTYGSEGVARRGQSNAYAQHGFREPAVYAVSQPRHRMDAHRRTSALRALYAHTACAERA